MQYEHIFFDLDHTLWDLETNSRETFSELFVKYRLNEKGIVSFEDFLNKYLHINNRMWDEYRKGLIDKDTLRYSRFYEVFQLFGINDRTLAETIGNEYVKNAPLKTNLFPYAIEILTYLQIKYSLHIITNGFEEVQHIKMKNSGIEHYFKNTITSEKAGYKKPDVRIFNYAIKLANAKIDNSLMIGDNLEADIIGAREAGMHQLFFNPKGEKHSEEITYEITSLKQLRDLL